MLEKVLYRQVISILFLVWSNLLQRGEGNWKYSKNAWKEGGGGGVMNLSKANIN